MPKTGNSDYLRKYRIAKYLVICLLISFSIESFGQVQYDYQQLTINDGLSNSSVNCIFKDSDNIMWFGTWSGLNSYDGKSFNNFMSEPFNEKSLSNNIIRDIIEDGDRNIWISTDHGINKYDKKQGEFNRFYFGYKENAPTREKSFNIRSDRSNNIFCFVNEWGIGYYNRSTKEFESLNIPHVNTFKVNNIHFDSKNNLWLVDEQGSVFKIKLGKKNKHGVIKVLSTDREELDFICESMYRGQNNQLIITSSTNEIYKIDAKSGRIILEEKLNLLIPEDDKIVTIYSSAEKTIIALNELGVMITDNNGNKIIDLSNLSIPLNIFSLYLDKSGILWLGTDGQGVFAVFPKQNNILSYSTHNLPQLGNNVVRSFLYDSNNDLWIGTKGGGIMHFQDFNFEENTHRKCTKYDVTNGLVNNSVFAICEEQSGKGIWIGTDGEGIHFFNKLQNKLYHLKNASNDQKTIDFGSVYSICQSNDSCLWLGTSGYGLIKLHVRHDQLQGLTIIAVKQYLANRKKQNSLSHNVIYSIIQDDKDVLWLGTRGGGLNRLEIKSEEFQVFKTNMDNPKSISSNDILCLLKDQSDKLWIGTSYGLNKFSGYNNGFPEFEYFSKNEGLPNNTVHGIVEDDKGQIWISTNKGLSRFDTDNNSFYNFTVSDGLQSNEFSDGAYLKYPFKNILFFGGINGFNVFNPDHIKVSNYSPEIYISSFKINNEEIQLAKLLSHEKNNTLVLKNNENFFSFDFVALDYIKNENCEYAYILEGFNNDWVNLGTSNSAVFTNVPSGKYVFKIRYTNHDKVWNKQVFTIPIKIKSPLWATLPAFGFYILLVGSLLWLTFLIVRKRKELRSKILAEEEKRAKEQEIHNAKLEFFTNLSHEICTPLTLIYGPTQKLLNYDQSDRYIKKYVRVINANANRVMSLVQQLFDFRKVETNHLDLKYEKIDLTEFFQYFIDSFIEKIEDNVFDFSIESPTSHIIWNTDRDKLEKIIFNLVSNATKYTPKKGTIKISYTTINSLLKIKIYNSGYGISEEDIKKIFDRFSILKLNDSSTIGSSSFRSGIGLAITKGLVELLKGTIAVNSKLNKYTEFDITIPYENSEELEKDENTELVLPKEQLVTQRIELADKQSNLPRYKEAADKQLILIIDDKKEIRNLVKDILSDKYKVIEASSAENADIILQEKHADLIICDILMPGTDGLTFSKKLKENFVTSHIPLILLTALQSVEKKIEGLSIGADAYITKPFHPTYLLVQIENLLSNKTKLKAFFNLSIENHDIPTELQIGEKDKELIKNITTIIENNLDNPELNPNYICEEISMSRMQFYRKLKGLVHQSPSEFIRNVKLKFAARYLVNTELSVLEILYQSGFNNKSYFFREFNNFFKCTPLEYREKYRKI